MIPKIIHQIWIGGDIPDKCLALSETIKDKNPGFSYNLWRGIPDKASTVVKEIFSSDIPDVAKSDVLRYEILRLYGGLYCDLDMECLRPFDELCSLNFVCGYELAKSVSNAFIGCVVGDPVIVDVVNTIVNKIKTSDVKKYDPHYVLNYTGPRIFTHVIERHLEVKVMPQEMFYPVCWDKTGKITEKSITDHKYFGLKEGGWMHTLETLRQKEIK